MGYNRQLTKMKKSIFVIAALFAATFAHAQITLEQTFNSKIYVPNSINYGANSNSWESSIYGDFLLSYEYQNNSRVISIYDANSYAELASFSIDEFLFIAQGILTGDDNLACLTDERIETPKQTHLYIKNTQGTIIQDLGLIDGYVYSKNLYTLPDGSNKFIITTEDSNYDYKTYIYALPAKGATKNHEVSSTKIESRKYLRNDQVLIDSNERTYTLIG